MNKFIFILVLLTSFTLRESFSQCLLFNEIKSATDLSNYNRATEYNNYYYLTGLGIKDTNELNKNFSSYAVLVKADKCGNTMWKYFYDNENSFYGNTVDDILAYDGYIYLLGGTQEQAAQGTSFIAKIDQNGKLIWYKIYRTNSNDITAYRFFLQNNTLVCYGYHEQRLNRPLLTNPYIMCIDTSGKMLWEKEHIQNNGQTRYLGIHSINKYFVGIIGPSFNYKYGKDSILYDGVLTCILDSQYNIINIDTIKNGFGSGVNLTAYNPELKQITIYLKHYVSSDSSICQIAFLDSTGKVEKIIDDPYNFLPNVVIPYRDGWLRNTNSMIIFYDSKFSEIKKIQYKTYDTGYFESSYITVVRKETAFLVAGKCRACNPYDFNPNVRYDRPTAIMVDSNFKDYGKAQPPFEAPKPFAAIKAFPNPALESITLQITETAAEYSIYNSMGMFISAGSMATSADISLTNIASGMYIIQLKSPQGNYIGNVKFLKK